MGRPPEPPHCAQGRDLSRISSSMASPRAFSAALPPSHSLAWTMWHLLYSRHLHLPTPATTPRSALTPRQYHPLGTAPSSLHLQKKLIQTKIKRAVFCPPRFNYTEQILVSKHRSFSSTLFLIEEKALLNEGEDDLCPEGLLAKSLLQFIRNYRV